MKPVLYITCSGSINSHFASKIEFVGNKRLKRSMPLLRFRHVRILPLNPVVTRTCVQVAALMTCHGIAPHKAFIPGIRSAQSVVGDACGAQRPASADQRRAVHDDSRRPCEESNHRPSAQRQKQLGRKHHAANERDISAQAALGPVGASLHHFRAVVVCHKDEGHRELGGV